MSSRRRIDTIVRFDAVAEHGVKAEGNAAGASANTLAELAAAGSRTVQLEVPIAATYPLGQVREAYPAAGERPPFSGRSS